MVISTGPRPTLTLEFDDLPSSEERERSRRRREHFERNLAWRQSHLGDIYREENRGKYYCVAGEELFVSESFEQVQAMARASHPEDEGIFFHRVSPVFDKPIKRIYAMQRSMAVD